jgi:hypothetical protein
MAGLSNSGKNALLTGFAGQAAFASLHTADPGTTGTTEVAGGTPAYARKTITWGTPASGSVTTGGALVFDVPGSTTITHLGYWTAATGGTFLGSRALDASQSFATQGTYTVQTGNLTETIA